MATFEGKNLEFDLGDGVRFEWVKILYYLEDLFNSEGGETLRMIARVRRACKKSCELSGMLTRKLCLQS